MITQSLPRDFVTKRLSPREYGNPIAYSLDTGEKLCTRCARLCERLNDPSTIIGYDRIDDTDFIYCSDCGRRI